MTSDAATDFLDLPPVKGEPPSRYRRPSVAEIRERHMSLGAYDRDGSLYPIRDIERDGR